MSSRMRPQASASSLAPSGTSSSSAAAADHANAAALAAVFRTLVFAGSVPLQFVIAEDELPPGADRSIEAYYIQAQRISYLPLLVPQIRKYFLDLVLDDNSAASLRDDDIWFEAEGGTPLKWHWPVGLLYDYHLSSRQPSLLPPPVPSPSSPNASTLPSSLAAVFAPLSAPSSDSPTSSPHLSFPGSLPPASSSAHTAHASADSQSTLRAHQYQRPRSRSSMRSASSGPGSGLLGLGGPGTVGEAVQPWRVTVHLREPPAGELGVGNRVEDARVGFMAMVKEADYVRWGSTKRVTNLRKEQQDALWDGVVQNNFDKYWTVASKLIPLPSLSSPSSTSPPTTRSPTPSSAASGAATSDANAVRSVPVRLFLPEGAPVVHELVPPLQADGSPTLLSHLLSSALPLLFPPLPSAPLAHPLVQGIHPPLSSEIGWLGACMAGADGWVSVVVVLDERGVE
ncbi:hypothetical protein JCM10207_000414 [Rhodosporidiobolus poonsookiae]